MSSQTSKGDDKNLSCKRDNKTLVKSTELPRHGNPNPPKDFIIQDSPPTQLEEGISSIRTSLSPYLSPIGSGFTRVGDIFQTGIAHSSSAIQGLSENQRPVFNGVLIAFAAFAGYRFSRRMKFLAGGAFALGASWALYPKEVSEKARLVMYIAENKLPDFTRQQYEKFIKPKDSIQQQPEATATTKTTS